MTSPAPPTNLAYASGNAAATVLSFTPSATGGATYRAYLADAIDGVMNLNDIQATALAGANSITLPAITGYPGIAYAIVRAASGGIEELQSSPASSRWNMMHPGISFQRGRILQEFSSNPY